MRRFRDKGATKKVARELWICHASIETQVGCQVAFQKTRPLELQNESAKKDDAHSLASGPASTNLLCSTAIPQYVYGTEIGPP